MTDLWPLKLTLIATWKSRVPKTTGQERICCEAAKELGQHRQWWVQNTAVHYNCICSAAALPGEHTNTPEGYSTPVVDVTYIQKSHLASLACNTNMHYSECSQIPSCVQKIQDKLCYGCVPLPLLPSLGQNRCLPMLKAVKGLVHAHRKS